MRLALAVVAALLVPATAVAATWSPPQHLSSGHTFIDDPGLVVSGNGRALATWLFQDGVGNPAVTGVSEASRAPGAGAFGRSRALTRATGINRDPETVQGVGAYSRDRALVATTQTVGPAGESRVRLSVRFGRTDGSFGRRITIRRAGGSANSASHVARVSLAVDARGDAALAWFEDRGTFTDRVYVALRRAGRAFGKPRRLVTGRVRNVAAAVGAAGDVLVVWDARGGLFTRFKPRSRSSFLATDPVRSDPTFFADLHPVVTPTGRAVLAWSAQFASEGGTRGPMFFEAAVRVAGGSRFRRAQLLERIDQPQGDERPIDAVVESTGDVAIAWTGANGAARVVRAARVQPSGAVGAAQDLGPGFLSDLAAGPVGRTLAVWDDGVEAPISSVHAALADAGQPFGAPEIVSPTGEDSHFGVAAFSGAAPTIVYSGRPAGSNLPVGQIRTFAEASTRSG